jgi:hypothetical protein
MLQLHQGNQEVGLFGVVRIQEIQSIASEGVNTWTEEETVRHEHTCQLL